MGHLKQNRVTCGNCERSWCMHCDPCPSALCHWCHGRGYSTAEMATLECPGCSEIALMEGDTVQALDIHDQEYTFTEFTCSECGHYETHTNP